MIQFSKCVVAFFFIWHIAPFETKMMYILMWTNDQVYSHNNRINMRNGLDGQTLFINSQCRHTDCYITDEQDFFGKDNVTAFDAIMFDGHSIDMYTTEADLPKKRRKEQKYILVCAEETCNYTSFACNPTTASFFNMTASQTNYEIRFWEDYDNTLREDPDLDEALCEYEPVNETLLLRDKQSALAWFIPNHTCTNFSTSFVAEYTTDLEEELISRGQFFDIYGCDSKRQCPRRGNITKCDNQLRNQYYFYIDFDSPDTEKNRCPLPNNSVPIFWGEQDSRYYPLGTYINAEEYMPETLADVIAHIINNPLKYNDFFRFRNRSRPYYPLNTRTFPCKLCAALHDPSIMNEYHTCSYVTLWTDEYNQVCNMYKEQTTRQHK